MTTRFTGLIPALALVAVGVIQHPAAAQVQNQTGSMAYPTPLSSGQVRIPAPTTRDTGNMAYPASPGGVAEPAPMGADTGNMATPGGRGALNSRSAAATPIAVRPGDPANSMRPDVAPSPAQTATARSLDTAPAAAPVPYSDFLPPDRAAAAPVRRMGRHAPMRHPVAHRVAAKPMTGKAASAAAAPAPAASAPAAPAPAASAPAASAPAAASTK